MPSVAGVRPNDQDGHSWSLGSRRYGTGPCKTLAGRVEEAIVQKIKREPKDK